MNSSMMNGLMDDSDIRGIVLTGTGRFFCAGADIDEFQLRQGIGPLFKSHLQGNHNFSSKDQIIKFLSNQKYFVNKKEPCKKINLSFSMENYYTNLQEILEGL